MPEFDVFSLLEFRKRTARSHGIKKNGNCKRKTRVQKLANCTIRDLAAKLDVHGRHCMLSYLSSLPIGPGRVAQSVGHLTRKSGVLGSIPGLATYFRFFFRFFKKGSCQLLAKVCARSTG